MKHCTYRIEIQRLSDGTPSLAVFANGTHRCFEAFHLGNGKLVVTTTAWIGGTAVSTTAYGIEATPSLERFFGTFLPFWPDASAFKQLQAIRRDLAVVRATASLHLIPSSDADRPLPQQPCPRDFRAGLES